MPRYLDHLLTSTTGAASRGGGYSIAGPRLDAEGERSSACEGDDAVLRLGAGVDGAERGQRDHGGACERLDLVPPVIAERLIYLPSAAPDSAS